TSQATTTTHSYSPTPTGGPNADCLTIKQAFPTVQFNIDCYNVSPNQTYPVTKTNYRRARRDVRMQLAGSISPLLGNLDQMQILDLSENQLTGSIPPELALCSRLSSISLFNNELTGAVPPTLLSVLSNNAAVIQFGVNCLDNETNQKATCTKKQMGDNCLPVSLDTRYMDFKYKPLWEALATSSYDLNAFDKIAASSDNFAVGEYLFQAFRKYAKELIWCMLHHPEYVYKSV
ncbi:UNVERIFIED_CONTAM: hypothetical protein HDU68_005460, partial [Siphonaria sp. JEL0065]